MKQVSWTSHRQNDSSEDKPFQPRSDEPLQLQPTSLRSDLLPCPAVCTKEVRKINPKLDIDWWALVLSRHLALEV